jgi:diguanylate cyclase (GGDEF)-like protein
MMTPSQVANIPNILIVDDDPTSITMLSNIFDEAYSLTIATNADDAIVLAEDRPDLILLDINLPDKDGFQVCKLIKSNARLSEIPIIFITSSNDSIIEEKGISIGAVDFVTKPYSAPVLKARVRTHLELKFKTDQLYALALRDPLTNIANRRYFDSVLNSEWNRLARSNKALSVIMIDIDYFKKINDSYGHQVGDDCIFYLAKLISETMRRPADLVARYGGEEFVVLLPETDINGALFLGEKIREKARQMHTLQPKEHPLPELTISIGCASTVPTTSGTPVELIRNADKSLYYAKAQGRNRVHWEQ